VSYYSGGDGLMKVGTTTVARVTTWSFTASQETLDVTTLGDRDRQLIGGTRSVSGSASISWYSAAGATDGDKMASTLLGNLIKTGSSVGVSDQVALTLGITDYDGAEKSITMTVVLTSIAMTSSQGEVLSAEVSFEAASAPSALTLDNA
tara:strand:- start:1778 stop:2224 length:447 start_codon:yes stop_codon:yes gene_type:complete